MALAHVLFDADGVLQELPRGWREAVRPYLGEHAEAFLELTWREEWPCLEGPVDYLPMLARHLALFGVEMPAEVFFRDVWCDIRVDDDSLSLVEALRARGLAVHLATNQEMHRARYMRHELGYDGLFDRSFYSFEVGHAKPGARFFKVVLEELGAEGHEVLFIDDSPENVESARAVGLRAVCWSLRLGHERLHAALAEHDIAPHDLGALGTVPGRAGREPPTPSPELRPGS